MKWRIAAGAALASLAIALPAVADDRAAARAAYDRGTRAFDRGDYARAAAEFARADALAPHPVALKWALLAAVHADDPVLGMTLVARAAGEHDDPSLASAAAAAKEKFERRVGAIAVRCPTGRTCRGQVDGSPVPVSDAPGLAAGEGPRAFVLPGTHAVDIDVDGRTARRLVDVVAGATVEIGADDAPQAIAPRASEITPEASRPITTAAPKQPARADRPARGPSPAWFWAGAAVTGVLGGITIASGVDTLNKHDAYLATREPGGDEAGRAAQTRTNVLIASTAVAAVGTAVLGLFVVDWRRDRRHSAFVVH